MSAGSKIEWTQDTWNPVLGCDRVSPGCDGCYAIGQTRIRSANPNPKVSVPFAGLVHRDGNGLDWTGQINELPDRLSQPLRWRRPRRIFVNSLSDLFHDGVADEFIARVFAVMAVAPQHTFQLLTKRHGRMRSLLNRAEFRAQVDDAIRGVVAEYTPDQVWYRAWPLPNVWIGVSVEDQKRADLRIPALLGTPAAVRWISAEPLLGPVDLRQVWNFCPEHDRPGRPDGWGFCVNCPDTRGLNWIVAGGESGPGARPMRAEWAESLRDQCTAAGVPFFMKQAGTALARSWECGDRKGGDPSEWPIELPREYPAVAR